MAVKIKWILKVYLPQLIVFVLVLDPKCVFARCVYTNIENGIVKSKFGSRVVRYKCSPGYEIFGNKIITCKNSNFDSPHPVCIKPGCELLPNPKNGATKYWRKESIALFFCDPGFKRNGEELSYCNGKKWNGTVPTCSATLTDNVKLSCDFEDNSLCGWRNDPIHDFNWKLQNKYTPSYHIYTGPAFDHTYQTEKDGYYMYVEGDDTKENDTARLISPLYPPSLTNNGCFVFFYHMYGRSIGTLRVYQIPESIELSDVVDSDNNKKKYTMFEKSGNQGDAWFRGVVDLDVFKENFQVIIEAVRGPGIVSDIAIDDVEIMQGERCVQNKQAPVASNQSTARDSCLNRCGSKYDAHYYECECNICCLDDSTCCVDYKEVCLYDDSSTTASIICGTPESGYSISTDHPMLPSPQMLDWTTESSTSVKANSSTTETSSSTIQNTPITNSTTTAKTIPTTITTTMSTTKTTPVKLSTTSTITKVTTTPRPITTKTTTTVVPSTITITPNTTKLPPLNNTTSLLPKPSDKSSTNATKTIWTFAFLNTTVKYIDTTKPYKEVNRHEYGKYNENVKYDQDAHEPDSSPEVKNEKSNHSTIAISISSVIIVIAVAVAAVFAVKKLRKTAYNQRTIWRLQPRSQRSPSSSDMRFLVQDEELEHDY